ncbi:MAG TPA: hypothetical protein VNI58_09360, partial [Mariprofundaceae bacterium]|nr:hypothetical protein [Mariprofundaceae bacterium]
GAMAVSIVVSMLILVIVGKFHGGKSVNVPWDPALKNEISPLGMRFIRFAILLFFGALILGVSALSLVSK